METIKITFEVNVDQIEEALENAGKTLDMELKKTIDWETFQKVMSEDVKMYIECDLEQFFIDALNGDATYTDFLTNIK